MPSSTFIASIALLSATIGAPVLAAGGEPTSRSAPPQVSEHRSSHHRAAAGFDHRMKPVANEATANAPGHGWRYFTDPAARRAVVISPQGDYYFSRGQGLRWVAAEQI